jgi:iron complex transport system ATP-binding protein
MKTFILKTKNLTIGYASKKGKIDIASNINIELEAGKLITLIGGNGIGKSTLLKTITSSKEERK